MLAALGASFRDAHGATLEPNGGELERIASVDLSGLFSFTGIELVGASDVTNPLAGPDGAAHVFEPQKGAGPDTVSRLDGGLRTLVEAFRSAPNVDVDALATTPGADNAGGIGFGIMLLGGTLLSGADYFLDLLDFDARARTSHLWSRVRDASTLRQLTASLFPQFAGGHKEPLFGRLWDALTWTGQKHGP